MTGDLSDLLSDAPDLVAECAGHGAVSGPVPQVLQAGVPVIVVSVGALADDAPGPVPSPGRRGGRRAPDPACGGDRGHRPAVGTCAGG
ncbi:hypothetical protein roselon_02318 [Roseibacterium elongatum DSM 19469]|uniref:Aspartate/homoserine dehydrogenase NAD-binding domain-containing protein n=1 Tax=Roseicyclus elongatus DSM 19469 TaxID=1294273 RepID=W8RTX1_9RHOB|nr:hypothetical protein roselon_02318 [Roseibacterium elongatum DSM 19469]